jgi:small subunit ribosomal protein S2
MPYVNQRWLGGMLTNFQTIQKRVDKMKEYRRMRDSGEFDAMPKKEALRLSRELEKLERNLGGISQLTKAPNAVFVLDTKLEHTAVTEANKLGLPLVAVVDTNCDPDLVDYVIPGNDDAIRAGDLMCRVIADAVMEGHFIRSKKAEATGAPVAEGGVAERSDAEQAEVDATQAEAREAAAAEAAARDARLAALAAEADADAATEEAAAAAPAEEAAAPVDEEEAAAPAPTEESPAPAEDAGPAESSAAEETPEDTPRDFGEGSAPANADGSMPEGFSIKGNADSMKFHQPDGRWYEATVAEVWFATAEAATAAGFTEAGK